MGDRDICQLDMYHFQEYYSSLFSSAPLIYGVSCSSDDLLKACNDRQPLFSKATPPPPPKHALKLIDTPALQYEKLFRSILEKGTSTQKENVIQNLKEDNAHDLFLKGRYYAKVQNNSTKALDFYLRSAQLGYDRAQVVVGHLYFKTLTTTPYDQQSKASLAKCVEYFLKAYRQHNADAMFALGILMDTNPFADINFHPTPDEDPISIWCKAAVRGHTAARRCLDAILNNRPEWFDEGKERIYRGLRTPSVPVLFPHILA